ncbi:MAG: 4-amino-4-deoxy-L-arabinose transferase-like glycosyltransferase [Pseudohongiellaceae bacterium]
MPALQRPSWDRPAIVSLTLVAALVRLSWIDAWPLWFDEINTLYRAADGGLTQILSRIAADVQAPLYDFFMAAVVAVFGDGLLSARLPPLLAGVLLVPLVAALVRQLGGGSRAVILAAAWAALDPYLVRYGVEARPYTCLALFSGLTLLSALRLVERRGQDSWQLALAGSALVLCHYYGVVAYGAMLIYLAMSLGALSPRLPRAVAAALAPIVVLGMWAPVALHQITQRSMDTIYSSLDLDTALQILDARSLTTPLATAGQSPGLVWLGRLLLLLLVSIGARAAWRAGSRSQLTLVKPPSAGRAPRLFALLGLVCVGVGCLLPGETLAGLASTLFREGRALDSPSLAFLDRVLLLVFAGGAALLTLGLCWPALERRASRSRSVARPVTLLLLLLVVPLGLAGVLGALGKPTLAVRNTIFMAPAVIVLVALGVERLPRQLPVLVLLALTVLGGFSTEQLPYFLRRLPWDKASAVVEQSGAEPLAHPPWLARCLEYHGERPWSSVYGSYRPAEVERWAATRSEVVLVAGFEVLADSSAVRQTLQRTFGAPETTALRGLRVFVYRR